MQSSHCLFAVVSNKTKWLGFGPEQLSVPKDFELPVSSFSRYGGHASINVRYDSQAVAPLYKIGDEAPGNSIAYLACESMFVVYRRSFISILLIVFLTFVVI